MEKQIVLQPKFANGNDVYVKVSVILDSKTAFTALCNSDGKISVQKLPTFKQVNIYGNWAGCAMTGMDAIVRNWGTLAEDIRKTVITCVNELPRSFQRLCMVMSFTQADMVEVHDYLRSTKAMFATLQEGIANGNVIITAAAPAEETRIGEGDYKDVNLAEINEWRRADMSEMPTEIAQSLLDAFASEPERVVVYSGSVYRAHEGAIEVRGASDSEIAKAKAEEYARQRKTIYMAMFKPGQAFGEFEEGNLYECRGGVQGNSATYSNIRLAGDDWRKVRTTRLNFYNVYAEAPEGANEATATQQA